MRSDFSKTSSWHLMLLFVVFTLKNNTMKFCSQPKPILVPFDCSEGIDAFIFFMYRNYIEL